MNITSDDFENMISDVIMIKFGEKIAKYVTSGDVSVDTACSIGFDLADIVTNIEMKLFF